MIFPLVPVYQTIGCIQGGTAGIGPFLFLIKIMKMKIWIVRDKIYRSESGFNNGDKDSLVMDLDLCSTPEELEFREEIENYIGSEYIEEASSITKDILIGANLDSYTKLCFLNGKDWYKPKKYQEQYK